MKIENKILFISGANRGIGKALVEQALKHNAKKIYTAARDISKIPQFNDSKVVALELDITNQEQIKNAAKIASDTEILINNAGVASFGSVLTAPIDTLKFDMDVNYYGTLNLTRAFLPNLQSKIQAAIASISSVVGLASMAGIGGYSASKAALFSAIQSMRAELKGKIEVYGIFPGPIDTDMARDFPMEKTSANVAAENILQAITKGEEDIFPDAMSKQASQLWKSNPKALEQQFSSM
ncbi:MAG: SDR family oxidoreductase [Rickettsiales bacterium]|nr:SDR family oxidoreductase [Rickettsiales bacterium]